MKTIYGITFRTDMTEDEAMKVCDNSETATDEDVMAAMYFFHMANWHIHGLPFSPDSDMGTLRDDLRRVVDGPSD